MAATAATPGSYARMFWGKRTWAQNPSGLSATLIGVGSFFPAAIAVLNNNYDITARMFADSENPWRTVISAPVSDNFFTSWGAGILYYSGFSPPNPQWWVRGRCFCVFSIPAGAKIGYARLHLPVYTLSPGGYPANYGTGASLQIRVNPTVADPPTAADWANAGTGTLIGTVAFPGIGPTSIDVSVPLSNLNIGGDTIFSLMSDQDYTNTSPGATSEFTGSNGGGPPDLQLWE